MASLRGPASGIEWVLRNGAAFWVGLKIAFWGGRLLTTT